MLPQLSIFLVLICGAAFAGVAVVAIRFSERLGKPALLATGMIDPCIFLYRADELIDATSPARRILSGCSGDDLPALKSWLSQRFSDLERLEAFATTGGAITLCGQSGTGSARMQLVAEETENGCLRLTLVQPDSESAGIVVDSLSQQAMEEELALLRRIVESTPVPIFRRDAEGAVVWANSTYLDAALQANPSAVNWPLPDLFYDNGDQEPAEPRRAHIPTGKDLRWFDCHSRDDGSGTLHYAIPIDGEVRAEQNLRDFLQTLTKTFADIPIGLAIFDQNRRLQLFNPALIDLTGLSAVFLTARPSLYSVLDQMRELRVVPEPRDYRSWRRQITTLESAASAGHHVETWSLPGGRTYRVTGRPHPNGAIAFLIEDITSEIALTREFRAEVTLGSQVLDAIDQALIVFNAVGQVVMTNKSYEDLWGGPPDRMSDALRIWQGDWDEAPGLKELKDALLSDALHRPERGILFAAAGQSALNWTVSALRGGKQMVRFVPTTNRTHQETNLAEANQVVSRQKTSINS